MEEPGSARFSTNCETRFSLQWFLCILTFTLECYGWVALALPVYANVAWGPERPLNKPAHTGRASATQPDCSEVTAVQRAHRADRGAVRTMPSGRPLRPVFGRSGSPDPTHWHRVASSTFAPTPPWRTVPSGTGFVPASADQSNRHGLPPALCGTQRSNAREFPRSRQLVASRRASRKAAAWPAY